MSRGLQWRLTLPLLILTVLLAVMIWDPSPRREPTLLNVSVLIREADTTPWASARQGMEQAAVDLGVELRFLALSEDNSAAEQQALLAREIEGGADGILLAPADPAALADAVKQASAKAVVVTLESDMSQSGAKACISVDNTAVGEALGRAVLNGVPQGGEAILLDSAPGSTGITARLTAAARVLEAEGRQVYVCRADQGRTLPDALGDALRTRRSGAVVAFEAPALEQAARVAQNAAHRPLVYGMGATPAVAAYLEQSYITAIAAQNEFAVGYLSVQTAVSTIRRTPSAAVVPLAFSMVRLENMYDPDNQKLLFPVTR